MSDKPEPGKPPVTKKIVKSGSTQPAAAIPKTPHQPTPKPAPKNPPTSVTKKTATSRLKPASREPHGPIEVVSSSDQQEEEQKARRNSMAAAASGSDAMKGISLRWKIMIAMAGVTLLAAMLIFVVVYNKAVDQLNAEIDAKGLRLVNTIASIDGDFWLMSLHQDPMIRRERVDSLIREVWPDWTSPEARAPILRKDGSLVDRHTKLWGSLGAEKVDAGKMFLNTLREAIKGVITDTELRPDVAATQKSNIDSQFDKKLNDPAYLKKMQELFDPLGKVLVPLAATEKIDLLEGGDIVQMSVLDITMGTDRPRSVSVNPNEMKLSEQEKRIIGGVEVGDATAIETEKSGAKRSRPSRSFRRDLEHRGAKLRFYVLLSLDHIADATGQLRKMIFLATLLSVLVGLAIAWWLSQRITEPVKTLIADINQVSEGDLDHQTMAHSNDEIGMLADTFNRMTTALKAAHEQEMEAKAMEHELGIAAEIQANLVPKRMLKVPGHDISAYYRPSKEVGGDYYDFIDIDENHCGLIVADVSGKGVPGSLVMSMTRALIRMEAERFKNTSPAQTLVYVNRMLAQDIKKGMFVTALYAILDKQTNKLAVTSAGHNPMLLIKGKEVIKVNPKGMALGIDKGALFERTISEETLQLVPGDRIVLYTDGTVEAMNEESEEFTDERFEALCQQLSTKDSNSFLNLIVKALDEHKGEAPQHDDQTIVTLRFTG